MAFLHKTAVGLIAFAGLSHFAPAQADIGTETADLLNLMYADTRLDCGGPSQPAFLCSGVMLRGVTPSTDILFYGVKAKDQARGAVSASYLRKDAKFTRLAYGYKSGFLFDTAHGNPEDHIDPKVTCAYPIDAGSNARAQNGCGDSPATVAKEDLCENLGITTAEQWLKRYRAAGTQRHAAQCAFNARGADSANAFYQNLRAMTLMGAESFAENNEILLEPWTVDAPRSPSVLASFYVDAAGVAGSRLSQIQWYQATRQFLPAISMKLPATVQADANFSYVAASQAIQPITEADQCDRYVESVRWTQYTGYKYGKTIRSMEVVPTECGRRVQANQTNNFFNELISKYYLQPAWVNNPDNHANSILAMRRQLVCHFTLLRDKAKWSLEPIRSYATHAVAIASGDCDFK